MLLRFICISILVWTGLASSTARADILEKALMPGALTKAHQKYENDCQQCHQKFDKNAQSRLCLECHKPVALDVQNKTGMHGRLVEKQCKTCHTDHKGNGFNIVKLDKANFDHGKTDFPLKGKHKEASRCEACHASKSKYSEAPSQCVDCHRRQDDEKGHRGSLGKKCADCHQENNWKETQFNHEKTAFPIAGGKHQSVKCQSCHIDRIYNNAVKECVACHKNDDDERGHRGRFGAKCETCHTDRSWKTVKFNHSIDTHFPLKGKHSNAKCDSCHTNERGNPYKFKTSTRCVDCHRRDDQDRGHKGDLGEKCESCHNERTWKGTNFDHDLTRFPLVEKHKDAKCESCHIGGVTGKQAQIKLSVECVSCHQKDDRQRGHQGRYGERCGACHTEKTWASTTFDHNREIKFILRGLHQRVKCDSCHLLAYGSLFQKQKLPQQCIGCHRKDDKHNQQLGNQCDSCHDEKSWKGVVYDHNKSKFPLTGSHIKTQCKGCHQSLAFHDAPKTCSLCHGKDDPHQHRFSQKCETCHTTGTWQSWDFDHSKTRFQLDGAHVKVECYACHQIGRGDSSKLDMSCFTCHRKDDAHDGGFGGQCERCHNSERWRKVKK